MHRYKLTISYDGTDYAGWQIQPNALSIQELIEKALSIILKKQTKVIASGRTDSGVHAIGQVAHFSTENPFDMKKLQYCLNGLLPHDIRIKNIEKTSCNFHARFHAKSKMYRYYLYLDAVQDPFWKKYSYHIRKAIDISALEKGLELFRGTHDFTSFANESNKGSAKNNPIKTIKTLEIKTEDWGISLVFEANGFLYKMVRNIMGTLVHLSMNQLSQEDIVTIFKAKDRRKAPAALPPQGLFLMHVNYECDPSESNQSIQSEGHPYRSLSQVAGGDSDKSKQLEPASSEGL